MFGPELSSFLYNLRVAVPNSHQYWEWTRRCTVSALAGVQEPFCEVNSQVDAGFIQIFGSPTPGTEAYLLHAAPGWDRNRRPTPVVLVHGAGLDATSFTNLWDMGYTGLQQQLLQLGYRVFALTFPHSHGDNFYQALHLADAVNQVCQLCGVKQVDLVTHSKGGIAARLYLSGLGGVPYREDVRRLVMLGVPNLGTDFSFRNPALSYMIYLTGGNGVIPWDHLDYLGSPVDVARRSIYREGAFPGQCQLLYRWDEVYPLDVTQQDWWTTYYGGKGYFSRSRGIETALRDGDRLVERLEHSGLHAGVEVSLLAGKSSLFAMIPLQSSIPGDGVVFLDSALHSEGLLSAGARLRQKHILPLNHIELLYHPRVARWIDWQLTP